MTMRVPTPRNPAYGCLFAPANWQHIVIIKFFYCDSLHQLAILCDSLNSGNKEIKSMTCDSLHQFSLRIYKEKRGIGEMLLYIRGSTVATVATICIN